MGGLVTVTFAFTGSVQPWVVPAGVSSLLASVASASGGYGDGNPGWSPQSMSPPSGVPGTPGVGDVATAVVPVTPGATLQLYVAGQGGSKPLGGSQTSGRPDDGSPGGFGYHAGGAGGGIIPLSHTGLSELWRAMGGGGGGGSSAIVDQTSAVLIEAGGGAGSGASLLPGVFAGAAGIGSGGGPGGRGGGAGAVAGNGQAMGPSDDDALIGGYGATTTTDGAGGAAAVGSVGGASPTDVVSGAGLRGLSGAGGAGGPVPASLVAGQVPFVYYTPSGGGGGGGGTFGGGGGGMGYAGYGVFAQSGSGGGAGSTSVIGTATNVVIASALILGSGYITLQYAGPGGGEVMIV